jgi:hypothetical protein
VIKLRAKKAAIAIVATKWFDGKFGQEGLEKASCLGSTGALALAPWTTERHGARLQNEV